MRANMYRLENVLRSGWFHQGRTTSWSPLTDALSISVNWFAHDVSLWEARPAGRRYIRSEIPRQGNFNV